jgi:tellurite resistance-related uncharacterized protein
VRREIVGFRPDDVGDWVAELDCLHGQHVRHRPPLWPHPWVETAAGRSEHIGTVLDCPLCDRAELPDGLVIARTAGPFGASTLPAGLRRDHRVASRTWGRLRVIEGNASFTMQTDPAIERKLEAGDEQAIPPGVLHAVDLASGTVAVDFFVRSD